MVSSQLTFRADACMITLALFSKYASCQKPLKKSASDAQCSTAVATRIKESKLSFAVFSWQTHSGVHSMVSRGATVKSDVGLHARPATFLVQKATGFACSIWLEKGDFKVNAKSLLGVLSLAAAQGDVIMVHADGGDAQVAVDEMVEMIESD